MEISSCMWRERLQRLVKKMPLSNLLHISLAQILTQSGHRASHPQLLWTSFTPRMTRLKEAMAGQKYSWCTFHCCEVTRLHLWPNPSNASVPRTEKPAQSSLSVWHIEEQLPDFHDVHSPCNGHNQDAHSLVIRLPSHHRHWQGAALCCAVLYRYTSSSSKDHLI